HPALGVGPGAVVALGTQRDVRALEKQVPALMLDHAGAVTCDAEGGPLRGLLGMNPQTGEQLLAAFLPVVALTQEKRVGPVRGAGDDDAGRDVEFLGVLAVAFDTGLALRDRDLGLGR